MPTPLDERLNSITHQVAKAKTYGDWRLAEMELRTLHARLGVIDIWEFGSFAERFEQLAQMIAAGLKPYDEAKRKREKWLALYSEAVTGRFKELYKVCSTETWRLTTWRFIQAQFTPISTMMIEPLSPYGGSLETQSFDAAVFFRDNYINFALRTPSNPRTYNQAISLITFQSNFGMPVDDILIRVCDRVLRDYAHAAYPDPDFIPAQSVA